jgi:hypothetical protein
MGDQKADKFSANVKQGAQRSVAHPTVHPNGIVGLQGIIGNRAVQRLLASSGAVQRKQTINDDVDITGNLTASTVASSNNAMVWGNLYVVGDKGTVIANNTPMSFTGGNSGGGGGEAKAASEPYNPTEL